MLQALGCTGTKAARTVPRNMPDIVVKKGSGPVSTKIEILAGDQAVTSVALWLLDATSPDHYKKIRDVKKATDAEGALYPVGTEAEIDGTYLEWGWTATRAPGSTAAQGMVRLSVQQGGKDVSGYPLQKPFDYDDVGPVSYSLTRHIRVAD